MPLAETSILELWEGARAQLHQAAADAVFLEGSIAEGFGNERSDVDFVGIVDDGSALPTMPYVMFVQDRRVEVRFLSSTRLRAQLGEVARAVREGPRAMAELSWDLLDRCHRFLRCKPLHNPALIRTLQGELPFEQLQQAVSSWFEDFSRQTARYAVALRALEQPEYACAWIRTATLHAAKCYAARLGETYVGLKWLSLQLGRAEVDETLVKRFWDFTHEPRGAAPDDYVKRGLDLVRALGVEGAEPELSNVRLGPRSGVTTWQIGERVHVVRGEDVFALGAEAAAVWRSITWETPLVAVQKRGDHLAEFARMGLVALCWSDGDEIRARKHFTNGPVTALPLLSLDGAQLDGKRQVQLLPVPARRFAEAGMEMTWANIGLENAREDAEGALRRGQWRVLQYSLERVTQMGCLVALAAHGVSPAPPLEEATLEAMRLLPMEPSLVDDLRALERSPIASEQEARRQFALADEAAVRLRQLAGESRFPASFESTSGWRSTVLLGYDWINLMAHLEGRFPMTGPGGRGTLEEARDVLAASAH